MPPGAQTLLVASERSDKRTKVFWAVKSSELPRKLTKTTNSDSHELGHDRLHHKQGKLGLLKDYKIYTVTDICEREANLFAYATRLESGSTPN